MPPRLFNNNIGSYHIHFCYPIEPNEYVLDVYKLLRRLTERKEFIIRDLHTEVIVKCNPYINSLVSSPTIVIKTHFSGACAISPQWRLINSKDKCKYEIKHECPIYIRQEGADKIIFIPKAEIISRGTFDDVRHEIGFGEIKGYSGMITIPNAILKQKCIQLR